jgi:hypothetical protein
MKNFHPKGIKGTIGLVINKPVAAFRWRKNRNQYALGATKKRLLYKICYLIQIP